jgi:hypothetical protein
MLLCETRKHREEEQEGNDYCGINHKWIPIDDCPCVNHEKVQYDIQTRIELRG